MGRGRGERFPSGNHTESEGIDHATSLLQPITRRGTTRSRRGLSPVPRAFARPPRSHSADVDRGASSRLSCRSIKEHMTSPKRPGNVCFRHEENLKDGKVIRVNGAGSSAIPLKIIERLRAAVRSPGFEGQGRPPTPPRTERKSGVKEEEESFVLVPGAGHVGRRMGLAVPVSEVTGGNGPSLTVRAVDSGIFPGSSLWCQRRTRDR